MTERPESLVVRRRASSAVSWMIGRWPDDLRFEDARVPFEGFFRGAERAAAGIWPESSLTTTARIARRR